MKKTNILIATGIYPPDVGGPATYSKLLADEFPKRGIDVKVLTFGSVRHLPKVVRHFVYLFKILKLSERADIIYAQDPISVGLPALWAARLLRKRFFLRLGGDYAWEQGVARFGVKDSLDEFVKNYDECPFSVRMLKKIQTYVAQHAEKVIVPSAYLANIVQFWEGKKGKMRIQVVYNAFSSPSIPETKEELRRKLNLKSIVILSTGRFVSWKGFDMLIEIMPRLRECIPGATLLIGGEGPEGSHLETLIQKYGVSSYVKLLGGLSKSELAEYIKASDIFALNTGYEGLSHQLLEVMALRIPIVTTDVGGNRELIENGISGVLLKHNDKEGFITAIKNAIQKKDINMIDCAYKKAQQLTLGRMIGETINVLGV